MSSLFYPNRSTPQTGILAIDAGNYSADLTLWTAPGYDYSPSHPPQERMRITTEGLVGIGMYPTTNFSVNGNASISATLTAATVNATSSLQVNGTDISSICPIYL